MNDINKPIRDAFYSSLNGNLSYAGQDVPVCDEILKTTLNAKNYVLLKNQTAVPDQTKSTFDAQATITLDIVTKTGDSASHDITDAIAGQILLLLLPTPNTHSLTPPANWQFLDVVKTLDTPLFGLSGTTNIVRRLMTFQFRVVQN